MDWRATQRTRCEWRISMLNQISEIGNKVAHWMGDKTSFGSVPKDADMNRYKESLDFGALNNILHFEGYDRETGIFYNKNSQGFILEASLLLGASEETATILTSIIVDVLPKNADLQFVLWGSDKIGNILDQFEAERSRKGEIFEWLAKKRTDFLKGGAYKSPATGYFTQFQVVFQFQSQPNKNKILPAI